MVRILLKSFFIINALPNTLIGLLLGALGIISGGSWQVKRGCIEFHGGLVTKFLKNIPPFSPKRGMAAMTWGHVIIGQDPKMLDRARDHEHIHVRQYEVLGMLFVPLYVGCSILLWLGRRDPYLDNPLEQEAYGKIDRQGK